ncbi:MAG TPA: DivIVA domain-containing protein [Acidimicrobiia bacterium]|nr:DivIVA domain-containing protein [Acidimicrobiia bacterium]
MDVTPSDLRSIELREAWRGYRQDDVDQLLDRVAGTIERLSGQVQRLSDRLAEAENEAGLGREADEMLRRTLLLAQRTADAAVAEAQERARRVLSESEAHAHSIVSGAEEEARRIAIAERQRVENEIHALISQRDVLLADVEALEHTARDQRRRLKEFLDAEIARIDERPYWEPATPVTASPEPADGAPVLAPPPSPSVHVDLASAEEGSGGEAGSVPPGDDITDEGLAVGPYDDPSDDAYDDAQELTAAEASPSTWDEVSLEETPGDLLPARRRRWRMRDDDLDPEPPTDEFFRDLRQAVADETPLGPRDELSDPGIRPEAAAEAAPSSPLDEPESVEPPAPPEPGAGEFAVHGTGFFDQDDPRRRS